MKKIKLEILVVSFALFNEAAIAQGGFDTICWNEASSIEEAISMGDSCRLFLTINEYNSDVSSTLVIDKSLSRCKNMGVLGIGTTRYLKIDADFSVFTYLEEFGIGGYIQKNVVNNSIKHCGNLERVGIGYLDSNYIFPQFLNHLNNDSVRLSLRYHFENINVDKISKRLVLFLRKTSVRKISLYTLKDLDLTYKKEELLKTKRFKKIMKMVRKNRISLSFFGIIMK